MDILESCVNKIQKEENEETGTISDNTDSSNTTSFSTTADANTPYDNIFRKSHYCSHNNINTEIVLLLEQASKYVSYSKKNRSKRRQQALWKKELLKLQNILQDAEFVDSLRKRVYNVEYQNYEKPLCVYKDSGKWDDKEMTLTLLKQKYQVLKEEHKDLLENIEDKINLELIKAGIFYNKKDVRNIFEFVRGQEVKLNIQKKVVKVQNDLIESIMMNNTMNKRKLRLSQRKIQKLIEFCANYFQENTKAKRDIKNITNLFVEYKMVLENLAHCCEQIGGDKIILMDGIKTAKTQADLSAATCLLKIKELDELQKNMILCEQKIEKLEIDLKDQFKKLEAESNKKVEARQQLSYVEDELTKNKNLLTEVFDCFQEIMYELDAHLVNNEKQNIGKYSLAEKRNKYNAMLRKIPESVAAIELVESMKKSRSQNTVGEIKKSQQELHLSKEQKEREEKEREEKEREERELKEREEKEREEREQKEREEKEREEKEREEKEREEKEREEKEREEKEREEKEREEKEREEKEEEERAVANKADLFTKTLEKIENDKLNYEQCVDFMYKMNIPLTQENFNELKEKNELTKKELSDYAMSLIQNEDEILENMITFFEIWDVKKSGFMKKDLFVFILEQFGDQFTIEESSFIQKELNATKGPTVCYVDILKKWIHGEENQ